MLASLHYLKYLRLAPLPFISLIGVCIANGIVFLLSAFLGKLIYDRLLTSLDGWLLVKVVLLSAILMAATSANALLYEAARSVMREKLAFALRLRFLEKAMRYEYRFYLKNETGTLVKACIGDLGMVAEALTSLSVLAGLVCQVLLGLTAFFYTKSWVTWIYLAVLAGYFIWFNLWKWPISWTAAKLERSYSGLYGFFGEFLLGMREIRLFGGQDYVFERFGKLQGAIRRHLIQNSMSHAGFWTAATFPWIAFPVVLWLAISDIATGELTVGLFVAMLSFLWGLFDPLVHSIEHLGSVHNGMMAARRLQAIPGQIPEQDGGACFPGLAQEIEFRDVTFGYPQSPKPILNRINLKIRKGQNVALIGESGSGKSTIANLLMRLHNGYTGTIRIDGKDLATFSPDSIRDRVGFFTQEVYLFSGTLRRNIDPSGSHSEAKLRDICARAGLEAWLARSPMGLDSKIEEGGANLSGGERQRIALARGLARDTEILVLDEPTSALDSQTEKAVWESILNASAGLTTITITHKMALLESMDWIFVLDQGVITREGTYRQILSSMAGPP